MKVMVTGGAGFIGSHVTIDLLAKGHEVVVIDDLSTGRQENVPVGARSIELSVLDPILRDVVADERPEVISHHAGQTDPRRSMDDPLFDARINALGGLNVIGAAVAAGVRKVIYASTAAVYGEPEALPVDEASPTRPISGYGVSKLAVEHWLRVASRQQGLDYTVLRYANVYGPRQRGDGEAGVIAIFAERMLNGRSGHIIGDGLQTRDFIFVGECARAHGLVLDGAASGRVINIGSGVETSIETLHGSLAGLSGFDILPERSPARPGEIRHMRFDVSKAYAEIGWKPEVSLEDGLKATLEHIRTSLGDSA